MPDVAPLGLGPTGDPVDVRDRVAVDGAVSVELAPWTARPAGWRRRCAAEGKTKKDAVRSLKRHISNAVYRQLLIDAAPAKSEARPGGHQERRSSTVAGFLPAHRLFGPSHFPDPTSHRTPVAGGPLPGRAS